MSRRSSHQGEGSEFFLECKAAFLAIFDEIEDKIESKKRLNDLLQQSGRNPNKARLDKYWPSGTDKLQFDDFVEICRKEPVTSADDLMKAFRKIDLNGDGYISLDELFKIMNAQGESMSREDVKKMIDEVDDNKDGRLDYKEHPALWKDRVYYEEFTNMIMKTTEDSKKFSQKMMEKKEKRRQRGDRYKASEANTSKTLDTSEQKPVNNQNETVKEPDSKHDEHTEIEHDHSDKAESESHVDKEKTTGDISKRRDSMGSKTSLRNEGGQSHVDKGSYSEAEKDSETSEKPKTISRRDSVSSKESVDIGRKEKGSKGTPRKELDPKNDKPPIPDNPKTPRSGAISHRSKGETPRESGRRLSKGDKSEMAGTSKETEESMHVSFKLNLPKDSARSVAEEIEHDEDDDIITPAPTPRFDLASPKSEDKRPRKDSPREKRGNTGDTNAHTHTALADNSDKHTSSEVHKAKDHKEKGGEKSQHANDVKQTEKKNTQEEKPSKENDTKRRKGSTASIKSSSSVKHTTDKSETDHDGKQPSEDFLSTTRSAKLDEIFKTSTRSDVSVKSATTERINKRLEKEQLKAERKHLHPKHEEKDDHVPKPVPRKHLEDSLKGGLKADDEKTNTQKSLSDKDINAPVPPPRKSISRLSEEDGPKPSPRVIKRDQAAKGKSSSKAGKMLDSRTLKDWVHHTSKGCFFYEDDEIVSHVFTMKLTQDTSVYLTAHPIQEPECLEVTSSEPVDTAILVFDESGKLLHWSEDRDSKGTYYLKCELSSGEYQVVPYTTGCRFKQRASDKQNTMKEAKLVKMADEKVQITVNFRKALEDIFDLCDLDNNGTMSRDEFNWFNLRTSGEELGEDEWEVVEERTELSNGEITKEGFIALNEMEAEDAQGDVEDLWITLSSMGLNKGLIMDEACPYRLDVYVESPGRKRTTLKVSGIESLQRPEYVTEICKYTIDLAGDPHRIRNMKDLYLYTYKNELRATIVVDNRSRSNVNLGVDCSNSKNVVSNHPDLDHTLDIDPQSTMIAHHLVPKSELSDWSVSCSETINK
ncbi:EF-hand calcium-binding domain-containing protein 7-like isoform X2 [Mya arenaria]|uniref:EF-hand calcium-binding domain-containing protein 7-like isoform X2 n=1 Tax=Mya arenaria TaxID=6604 RepID=UPI0022E5B11E|nr:EF-hand calcium-binding domain-containing protein 7-like isoform X2 [Mya arenaria]